MRDANRLWVIIDSEGRILHSTRNPIHYEMMVRYVKEAVSAGDNWELHEYVHVKHVPCKK